MAHADDAELWAGGTLARHARDGWEITIVTPRHDETRDDEAEAGATVLGAQLRQLDYLTIEAIQTVLKESQPAVVITHPTDDIHPEHQHAAHAVLAAIPEIVISAGRPQRLYTSDGYNNLNRLGHPLYLPAIIDITETFEIKMRALRCHRSQPINEHFGPMTEALGRLHGQRIGVRHAEAFRPIPILGRLFPAIGL
ncbi:PIG-L family deacetylase [Solwaraspora sp. WMMD1047]|uniref:PIG-L deacetylase family protein n=1 Tax=Solwaraspora sp. WMMD1047 TaxID=3016102 RepID=UPI0024159E24|nr:PIG-L deacetylase family protein [Solwaraspora sp. WMMD1047]MDG4830015.1 PIG-L family deacetylase [Solwaraspora sp. WMMD1047]